MYEVTLPTFDMIVVTQLYIRSCEPFDRYLKATLDLLYLWRLYCWAISSANRCSFLEQSQQSTKVRRVKDGSLVGHALLLACINSLYVRIIQSAGRYDRRVPELGLSFVFHFRSWRK